jgi:hypothetical protein
LLGNRVWCRFGCQWQPFWALTTVGFLNLELPQAGEPSRLLWKLFTTQCEMELEQ